MKVLLSLSGGMDSGTLLGKALSEYSSLDIRAVSFRYGSKHQFWENHAAKQICTHYHVPLQILDLHSIMTGFKSNLLTTGGAIPEGHYQAETMSQTVVPGRNIIFCSILAGMAWSYNAKKVMIGIHSGDHAIYPDCRPEFFEAMKTAIHHGSDGNVELDAPFLMMNKTSIIQLGAQLGVPYRLTRTCYKDQAYACGRCGSCQERLEAFANNGIEDPIAYHVRDILPKQ